MKLIVTRHKAAAEFIRQTLPEFADAPVIESATADEVEAAPDCHHAKGECDHAWPAWFCTEVADSMRDVAELIEEARS